eukprot:gene1495-882_t
MLHYFICACCCTSSYSRCLPLLLVFLRIYLFSASDYYRYLDVNVLLKPFQSVKLVLLLLSSIHLLCFEWEDVNAAITLFFLSFFLLFFFLSFFIPSRVATAIDKHKKLLAQRDRERLENPTHPQPKIIEDKRKLTGLEQSISDAWNSVRFCYICVCETSHLSQQNGSPSRTNLTCQEIVYLFCFYYVGPKSNQIESETQREISPHKKRTGKKSKASSIFHTYIIPLGSLIHIIKIVKGGSACALRGDNGQLGNKKRASANKQKNKTNHSLPSKKKKVSIIMGEASLLGQVPVSLSLVLIFALILLAGVMAGLILCTFSLDPNRLRGIAQSGNVKDAKKAEKLLKILDEPHWLLITLLIWNDIALETLPLLLDALLNPVLAVVVSVLVTLVFCEIIPQAVFIHNAFSVCAFLAPMIHILMYVCSPVAWPIAKLLDYIVGDKEVVPFQRRELKALIAYQDELRDKRRSAKEDVSGTHPSKAESEGSGEDDLEKEEMTIMLNVLSLSESRAKNMIQTPIADMYRLHSEAYITEEVVETIFHNGYNFVLVYEDPGNPDNVVSFFLTNTLALLVYRREEELIRVKDLQLRPLSRMSGETVGTEVFIGLQRLSPAIALIVDEATNAPAGVLTLRNVTELIHQTTFKAEMDPHNHSPMQIIMHSWKLFNKHEDGDGTVIPSLADSMRLFAMTQSGTWPPGAGRAESPRAESDTLSLYSAMSRPPGSCRDPGVTSWRAREENNNNRKNQWELFPWLPYTYLIIAFIAGVMGLRGTSHASFVYRSTSTPRSPRVYYFREKQKPKQTKKNGEPYAAAAWSRPAFRRQTQRRCPERKNLRKVGRVLDENPDAEFMYLRENEIRKFAPAKNMEKLRVLDLSMNQIGPKVDFLSFLPRIHHLYLSVNRIESLDGFSGLVGLETLCISDNRISSFEGLSNLPNLRVLSLNFNAISSFDQYPSLPNLHTLNLVGNPITENPSYRNMAIAVNNNSLVSIDGKPVKEDERAAVEPYKGKVVYCIRSGFVIEDESTVDSAAENFMLHNQRPRESDDQSVVRLHNIHITSEEGDRSVLMEGNKVNLSLCLQDNRAPEEVEKNPFASPNLFPTTFTISGDATEVFLVGCFNNWLEPIKMTKVEMSEEELAAQESAQQESENPPAEGEEVAPPPAPPAKPVPKFQTTLYLPPDTYEYRFIMDGEEKLDETGTHTSESHEGSVNRREVEAQETNLADKNTIFHIRWMRQASNGVFELIEREHGTSYVPTKADIGCCLRCEVLAYMDGQFSFLFFDMSSPVIPAPPSCTFLEIKGEAKENQMLYVEAHYFGGEEGTSSLSWSRVTLAGEEIPITPQTAGGQAFNAFAFKVTKECIGCTLKATFTPVRNDWVPGEPKSAVTETVVEGNPECEFIMISGNLIEDSELEVKAQYTGGTEGMSTYQWLRKGSSSQYMAIEGETKTTYHTTLEDVGHSLAVEYTPINDKGKEGEACRCVLDNRIAPATPEIRNISIYGELQENEVLVLQYEYIGGVAGTHQINWYRRHPGAKKPVPIGTHNSTSLTLTRAEIGATIEVIMIPVRSDGARGSNVLAKTSSVVLPGVPTVKALNIVGHPAVHQELSIEVEYTGGKEGSSRIHWTTEDPQSNAVVTVAENTRCYVVREEDSGKFLRVMYNPVREDGVEGDPMTNTVEIEAYARPKPRTPTPKVATPAPTPKETEAEKEEVAEVEQAENSAAEGEPAPVAEVEQAENPPAEGEPAPVAEVEQAENPPAEGEPAPVAEVEQAENPPAEGEPAPVAENPPAPADDGLLTLLWSRLTPFLYIYIFPLVLNMRVGETV